MIDELHVQNIALIRDATLIPSPGLTVLTGETGAGKTALLSACKLLMGARADSAMVRDGASQASVEGRLFVAADLRTEDGEGAAAETDAGDAAGTAGGSEGGSAAHEGEVAGVTVEGEQPDTAAPVELVVTRRLGADGRSRATLNGAMASVTELSLVVGPHIELCGQHEHQALLKAAQHGPLLDAWADLGDDAEAYRTAYDGVQQAQAQLQAVHDRAQASTLQLEEARFTLKSINAVDPQPEEYEQLSELLVKAENAETLARNSHGAAEALSGEGGALDALNSAISLLDEAARSDEALGAYAASLRDVSFVAEDVARDMASYCEDIDFDEGTLLQAQERMGALQGLMRSFGPTMADVFAQWEEAQELVSLVDDADDAVAQAQAALDRAEEHLATAAQRFTEKRLAAAEPFARAVNGVLDRLEMGGATLECLVETLEREAWNRAGASAVTFQFRPGKSMQARPLARIASGGEVSRVMLAIKVVLGAKDAAGTLIFDEVDAGVGGSTATALAAVLAELAESHQVIAITHLAQVAVVADTHYTVTKQEGDCPETHLQAVEGAEREREVARMLSGDATEASLAHAREMLGA